MNERPDISGMTNNTATADALDYILVVLKRKKRIALFTLACLVLSFAVSFIIPKTYKAETKILLPQRGGSGMAQMLSAFAGMSGMMPAGLDVKTPSDLYAEMLKSRTVLDKVVERFGLMDVYGVKFKEDARRKLLKKSLRVGNDKKSGLITIGVEDKSPRRASDMANAFVEELKLLNKGLAVGEAAERRLFFEEQLKDTKSALMKSEDAMKAFQERTGALQMESQAKAMIEGIADLRAQIAAKEVELRVMRTYSTQSNPDLQKSEEALKGMRDELERIEAGKTKRHDPLMPTGQMPGVGTEYVRRLRDLKFNETLYELLVKQYEAAKLDEARDASVIQIVDKAVPPEKKIKPRRAVIALLGGTIGFMLAVMTAFAVEYVETSPGAGEKAKLLIGHLPPALRKLISLLA